MLRRDFLPAADAARLLSVGEVAESRESFFKNRPRNLDFLLRCRYEWMQEFISKSQYGLEIGAGAGFSRLYFVGYNYILSDMESNPWLDKVFDATKIPLQDNSLDYIFESNVIHHISRPLNFFDEAYRTLKPGGVLLIQDVWGSFFLRTLLRIFRTEGYSYNLDVFDRSIDICDPRRLWAGNNVALNLLFEEKESQFKVSISTGLLVEKIEFSECFIFPLSGGVTSRFAVPQLPEFLLRALLRLDSAITNVAPHLLSLQVRVVMRKPLD